MQSCRLLETTVTDISSPRIKFETKECKPSGCTYRFSGVRWFAINGLIIFLGRLNVEPGLRWPIAPLNLVRQTNSVPIFGGCYIGSYLRNENCRHSEMRNKQRCTERWLQIRDRTTERAKNTQWSKDKDVSDTNERRVSRKKILL